MRVTIDRPFYAHLDLDANGALRLVIIRPDGREPALTLTGDALRQAVESAEPIDVALEVEVEASYSPGSPETPPSYSHGGLPPEGPEAEITAATVGGLDVLPYLSDHQLGTLADAIIDAAESGEED